MTYRSAVISGAVLTLLAGCSEDSEVGMQLAVEVEHSGPMVMDQERMWESDLGYTVVVSRAYLTLASVEIHACESATARLWNSVNLVGTAHAHGEASPTELGEPWVEDLLTADETAAELGSLEPPPDSYCLAHVMLGAADADANNLPSAFDMVGVTAYIEGHYQSPGGGADVPLTLTVTTSFEAEADFGDEPLRLSKDSPSAELGIHIDANDWFDGIDFDTTDTTAQSAAWMQNVVAGVFVHSH